MRAIDITGQKFGRLTAIEPVGRTNDGKITWLFICDCGNKHVANGKDVRTGHSRSCGCYASDQLVKRNFKHGHTRHNNISTLEFKAYTEMKARIYKKSYHAHEHYKARGITICDEWLDKQKGFINFYNALGDKPTPLHTLERIDNDKGYEPNNCRWATRKEQSNNRENTVRVSYLGETRSLTDWAKSLNLDYFKLYNRVKRGGMTMEEAVKTLQGNR